MIDRPDDPKGIGAWTRRVWLSAAILALPTLGCEGEGESKPKPSVPTEGSGKPASADLKTRKIATH